jgi:predicted DsbA family dithiol-disulfide isomerase
MPRLLLYHDFGSVFCRLALVVARDAATAAGLELETSPVELHPAPTPLPAVADLAADLDAARPFARTLGVPLHLPPLVPRTQKAHEAVAHARQHGRALDMAEAIYDAVWHRGLDTARLDVLAGLGAAIGLDPGPLHVDLGTDAWADDVARAQRDADAARIAALPTYRLDDRLLHGLLAPAELLEWIRG